MSIDQYSTTPSSNDLTNYFKTGMKPSQVKNAGWDVMADLASYSVSLSTAGGSANALSVANGRPFGALVAGLMQVLNPPAANTGAATFAPDGLAAAAIFANGAALAGGELQPNVPAYLKYDGTQWNLLNPARPGKNFLVDPCCRVAQGAAATLSTARQYGAVDLVQCWASGTAVSAGSITQDTTYANAEAATITSCKLAGVTITGTGKVFFRRFIESRDANSLKNRVALFSVLGFQDTGGNINASLTVNTATAQDNFTSVTNIGSGATVSLPTNTSTPVTAALSMGNCGNGVEVILEMDCGAVTTKDFYATDWQVCLATLSQLCVVPGFEDDLVGVMRYFEKSYEYGTLPGTATVSGLISTNVVTTWPNGVTSRPNGVQFRVPKIIAPTVTFYSVNSGASGKVYDPVAGADKAVTLVPDTKFVAPTNSSGGSILAGDAVNYHFLADARL